MYVIANKNYLIHHGVKGQKWGIRKYQNADGSLTEAGKKRYAGDRGLVRRWRDSKKAANIINGQIKYNKAKKGETKGTYNNLNSSLLENLSYTKRYK